MEKIGISLSESMGAVDGEKARVCGIENRIIGLTGLGRVCGGSAVAM